ncbi:RING finger and WD repeat domain-containing protein 3 [Echinococcus granulosus]|uniref:RING-type E3 ubiquitin transferase n=1 Tax=Echinococcus granulosus TaxID=6210 RepID=W6UTF6_ECHGR|nr:RING finger and WD repeat domain-containing protein 3 [Echinococcus granulosus]EUB61647.1 RING finger and WD repeat domain-containing protein 3 [Echinococcus granulosus]
MITFTSSSEHFNFGKRSTMHISEFLVNGRRLQWRFSVESSSRFFGTSLRSKPLGEPNTLLHHVYDDSTEPVEEVIGLDLFEEDGTENQMGNFPLSDTSGRSPMEESDICSICFESWTTSGPHRICCLKCGHLFGRSCVTKWLMSARPKPGTCPQCNAKAHTKDIRAIDTTDRDRALEDLEVERKLRKKVELELSEYKFKLQLACSDVENLRDELNSLRAVISTSKNAQLSPSSLSKRPKLSDLSVGSYNMVKTLNISPVHTNDLRPLKFMHLHAQPIRDLAFHPEQQDAIVASASMDKSLKLTSLLVDQVVQTYQCSSPIWSCCWAFPSPNYLFAGCVNGSVYLFDIRVTSRPASVFAISASSTAPVIALQYISPNPSDPTFQSGGLLTGQLTQVAFLEEAVTTTAAVVGGGDEERRYRSYPLSLEGSLVSLSSLHDERGLFLASYRPSTRVPRVRHLCTRLKASQAVGSETGMPRPHGYDCESVASLFGGTQMRMLSRARLFRQEKSDQRKAPQKIVSSLKSSLNSSGPHVGTYLSHLRTAYQILAASGDDDAGGALIWNCTTGVRIQTLTVASATIPVIDVCTFNNGGNLALLTDHQIDVFKWSQSYGSDT